MSHVAKFWCLILQSRTLCSTVVEISLGVTVCYLQVCFCLACVNGYMMHSSSINYICMERVDNEIIIIWKSYMWTAEWRIIWRSYIRTFCSCEKKAWQKFRLVRDITSMIFLQIILHSAVHFHIFIISSSSFHGFLTNQFNDLLPVGLLA